MRPIGILPIADFAAFTKRIGPVVPSFATGGPIRLSVLLVDVDNAGKNVISELDARLIPGNDARKIFQFDSKFVVGPSPINKYIIS